MTTRGAQRIIQEREQLKLRKYALLAQKHDGGCVMPFVIDAYGAFGQCADELLERLATVATSNGSSSSRRVYRDSSSEDGDRCATWQLPPGGLCANEHPAV